MDRDIAQRPNTGSCSMLFALKYLDTCDDEPCWDEIASHIIAKWVGEEYFLVFFLVNLFLNRCLEWLVIRH